MAPSPRYDAPQVQMRRLAEQARREGLTFDQFWQRAVRPGVPHVKATDSAPPEGCVVWPTGYDDRMPWVAAITGSKDAWRRSYERQPATGPEEALAFLAVEGLLPSAEPAAAADDEPPVVIAA